MPLRCNFKLVGFAEQAINAHPQVLIVEMRQLKLAENYHGTLVMSLRHLLSDGVRVRVLYRSEEQDDVEKLKEVFIKLSLADADKQQGLIEDLLSFHLLQEKRSLEGMDLTTVFETSPPQKLNFTAKDYELPSLNGFLIWLHLKHKYGIQKFDYELAQMFFKKLVHLKFYNRFLELRPELSLDQIENHINELYISVTRHAAQRKLADMHIHPTSSVQPQFIVSKIQQHPELDFSKLNADPIFANRLRELGYSSIEAIAHAGDVVTMKLLIATPLLGNGSLHEYLMRYDIIKKVMQTSLDLVTTTTQTAADCFAMGLRHLELRFGILRVHNENIVPDSELLNWRLMPEGSAKQQKFIDLLKHTQFFSTLVAYFEGLRQFAAQQKDFTFAMLVIVRKSMTLEMFRFLAEQVVGFKQGRDFYNDQNLLNLLPQILDLDVKINKNYLANLRNSLVGFDTADNEYQMDASGQMQWRYRPRSHAAVFKYLQDTHLFTQFTSHAGESFASLENGLDAIEEAVDHLRVNRLGHAVALGIDPEIYLWSRDAYGEVYSLERILNLKKRQKQLQKKLKQLGVAVESNFSGNLQTGNVLNGFKHPTHLLHLQGVKVLMGTDGTSMNNTHIAKEVAHMRLALGMESESVDQILKTTLQFAGHYDQPQTFFQEGYKGAMGAQLKAMAQSTLETMVAEYEQALEKIIEKISRSSHPTWVLQECLVLMALGFLKKNPFQIKVARQKFRKWCRLQSLEFDFELFDAFQSDFTRILRKVVSLRKVWPEEKVVEWMDRGFKSEMAGEWNSAWSQYLKAAFHVRDTYLAKAFLLEYLPRVLRSALQSAALTR